MTGRAISKEAKEQALKHLATNQMDVFKMLTEKQGFVKSVAARFILNNLPHPKGANIHKDLIQHLPITEQRLIEKANEKRLSKARIFNK